MPLPVSETGYKSHFIHPNEIALFESVHDYLGSWLDSQDSPAYRAKIDESRHMYLF